MPNNSNETISASQTQTELTSEKVTTLEFTSSLYESIIMQSGQEKKL